MPVWFFSCSFPAPDISRTIGISSQGNSCLSLAVLKWSCSRCLLFSTRKSTKWRSPVLLGSLDNAIEKERKFQLDTVMTEEKDSDPTTGSGPIMEVEDLEEI